MLGGIRVAWWTSSAGVAKVMKQCEQRVSLQAAAPAVAAVPLKGLHIVGRAGRKQRFVCLRIGTAACRTTRGSGSARTRIGRI